MADLWLALTAAAAVSGAVYLISLRLHPRVPCRACDGSGRTQDRVWKRATGTCPQCSGRGWKTRLGVRFLAPARHRRLTGRPAGHKSIDQRRG